jgi:hypothetical protein
LQASAEANLAQETIGPHRMGQLGAENLERHRSVALRLLGEIDRGDAAPAQLASENLAARQGAS